MKTKKLLVLLSIFFVQVMLSQNKVSVLLDSVYSYATGGFKRFNIVLPKNYYMTEERYKVLFLLHGYSGNHNDWVNKTFLVKYLKNHNLIVVTPEADNSWYSNSPVMKNRNYEDYIVKELIPYVEKKYRIISTRHGRAIAGLSMGGYGSVKIGLKYPEMFGFVGSFSGAFDWMKFIEREGHLSQSLREAFGPTRSEHWDKNNVYVLIDSIKTLNLPYFYISCGKDDQIDGLLLSNRKLIEKLHQKGILYEYHELPGGHTWHFWDEEIKRFLRMLSEKWEQKEK